MNSVCLIGNLTRDPELRYTTGQQPMAICKFGLAVEDPRGDKDKTSFVNIVVFGRMAESCNTYLAKGKKAGITGHIQTGSYQHRDGYTVYTTDIIADHVKFLSPSQQQQNGYSTWPPQDSNQQPQQPQYQPQPQQQTFNQNPPQQQPQQAPPPAQGNNYDNPPQGYTALQDDDIPF